MVSKPSKKPDRTLRNAIVARKTIEKDVTTSFFRSQFLCTGHNMPAKWPRKQGHTR